MTDRCFIMLKPMRAGLSGYARIQAEAGGASAFISARGLPVKRVNAYWMGGGAARAIATAQVNPRGEAALEARLPDGISAPERLQALLIIGEGEGGKPVPLLIGLCARQSAGSLLDAKNAMLALCERIGRARAARGESDAAPKEAASISADEAERANRRADARQTSDAIPMPARYPTPQVANSPISHADMPAPQAAPAPMPARSFARAVRVKPRAIEPSREVFLPAIDPRPYIQAEEQPVTPSTLPESPPEERPQKPASFPLPPPRPNTSRPVDALPALRYPPGFAALGVRLDARIPENPLGMRGWRFACLDERRAVYVGRQALDGRVVRIAYAIRGERPPDDDKPYRRARGIDGDTFHVLIQRI